MKGSGGGGADNVFLSVNVFHRGIGPVNSVKLQLFPYPSI